MGQEIIKPDLSGRISKSSDCLTVLFPGFGYSFDRPLLQSAYEKAEAAGHDIIRIRYGGLYYKNIPLKEAVAKSFSPAVKSSLALLEESLDKYKEVYFVSKSFGTMVAGELTRRWKNKNIKNFYLTPIEESFPYLSEMPALAAVGTKDPLISGNFIQKLQNMKKTVVFVYQGADHSLEIKEDREQSIKILEDIKGKYDLFFHKKQFPEKQ